MEVEVLREQLNSTPPKTEYISKLLHLFRDALFKFVPSKSEIHNLIKNDLPLDNLDEKNIPLIIDRFIHWIEQFQAPVHDNITKKWREDFKNANNYTDFIIEFLENYMKHTEIVNKEIWDARVRIANNESPIPPQHRAKGENGVPDNMKSGK